ncbi:MAG TPA: CBS domain-containing protein [Niabella sp.]|jgi:CBS domain-containing protein|nr:CBS domain-containing protein [Chitinophagaceae bacterium]HRN49078.1 CBS domain-containing protein [Niabella sp.]HRO83194.1 CBS domain-containing protein [Niabella sp.]
MSNVTKMLSRKGYSSISLPSGSTVLQAIELMANRNIGALVVLEAGKYAGILTERDYTRKVILKGKHSNDTKVEDIMTTDLPRVSPSDSVEHCMTLMSDKSIRYLPVFDGEQMVGIISISDVVTETILQQKETISHLENYIHGQQ